MRFKFRLRWSRARREDLARIGILDMRTMLLVGGIGPFAAARAATPARLLEGAGLGTVLPPTLEDGDGGLL